MYVTAKPINLLTIPRRTIPKGTRLSDVYEAHDGMFYAIAHQDGQQTKITLARDEFETAK